MSAQANLASMVMKGSASQYCLGRLWNCRRQRGYPALIPAAAITRLQISISRRDQRAEFLWRRRRRDVAAIDQLLLHVRKRQRVTDFGVHPLDDRRRRLRRHGVAEPGHEGDARHGLLDRRRFRHQRIAALRRYGEQAHLSRRARAETPRLPARP